MSGNFTTWLIRLFYPQKRARNAWDSQTAAPTDRWTVHRVAPLPAGSLMSHQNGSVQIDSARSRAAAAHSMISCGYHGSMQTGQPSRTALGAAAHRAAHQVLERGRILSDPLAIAILGAPVESLNDESRHESFNRALRLFIALRSRLAEEAVAAHMTRGLRQLVILGAGLDTYAYRSPFGSTLRFFEVDHPATQEWKRARLRAAGISIPGSLRFAPVDFERETLADGLAAAGLDPGLPTFFSWLGVVPYLTEAAIFGTLAYIAGLSGGAQVIFDYANPRTDGDPARAGHEVLAARVAFIGEAFENYFDTDVLTERLRGLGFTDMQDWGPAQIAARFFPGRVANPTNRGGHILRASQSLAQSR